ncbi:MAG: MFS transporter [bacterium]
MTEEEAKSFFQTRVFWVVFCGTVVLALSIGIRLTFGLFLQPMSAAMGWGREVFALAIALQNLIWGASQPFIGMIADRKGAGRVVAVGGVGYGLGLYLMSQSTTPLALNFSAGLVIGLALSGTSFAVVLGAVGRAVSVKRRSMALGIASAGGSIGQFAILPVGQLMIGTQGWVFALIALGAIAAMATPFAAVLAGRPSPAAVGEPAQGIGGALAEAGGHRGFQLLTGGFFVCGFHVTFIGTHLPAYIVDHGLSPGVGALALITIGFFNILGSFFWGVMGGRYSKRHSLSALYLARAVVILAFVSVPVTVTSVLVFAGAMGFLWLGTVPLTNALVGQIFGVRYISTLFGIVFFSHQVGAFLGVWLGGKVYDLTGSYDSVWYIAIVLGVVAALLHWPINEAPVARLAEAGTEAGD